MKHSILFVCLGNICRSPAAQGVMLDVIRRRGLEDSFEVDSAGTIAYHAGDGPDRRMIQAAGRRGFRLDHISRRIRPNDFDDFDVIVAMDDKNYDDLRALAPTPEHEKHILKMADYFSPAMAERYDCVPDPYYEGPEGFELVLDMLDDACETLLNKIIENEKH